MQTQTQSRESERQASCAKQCTRERLTVEKSIKNKFRKKHH